MSMITALYPRVNVPWFPTKLTRNTILFSSCEKTLEDNATIDPYKYPSIQTLFTNSKEKTTISANNIIHLNHINHALTI